MELRRDDLQQYSFVIGSYATHMTFMPRLYGPIMLFNFGSVLSEEFGDSRII